MRVLAVRFVVLVILAGCVTTQESTSKVAELAATLLADFGGFTLSPAGKNLAGSNLFAVSAYPERGKKYDFRPTAKQVATFALDNRAVLEKPRHTIGGWCEGKDSAPPCHLDISIVLADEAQAVALGVACNQQAIAHLTPQIRFIETGGDGGVLSGAALAKCREAASRLSN
jgi:hypothetical protein